MLSTLAQVGSRIPPGPDLLLPGITLVSVGLLLALLVIFVGTWLRTRAPFTLGLVLFVGVLLLEDLGRIARLFRVQSPALTVVPELLGVAALVVLLYLATR